MIRGIDSEAEVAADLSPERRFPAIDLELVRIERRVREFRGRRNGCSLFLDGLEFEVGSRCRDCVGQAFYSQTETRQHIVVNDVVHEDCVRIECVLFEHYTVCEIRVVADGEISGFEGTLYDRSGMPCCEGPHKTEIGLFSEEIQTVR